MKANFKSFIGVILIAIGILFFLKVLGVINFSVWRGFGTYWPIGLIFAGLALIFRIRWLAFAFIFLTALLGGFYFMSMTEVGEQRHIVKEVSLDDNIDNLRLNVGFGAGNMKIGSDSRYLVRHEVETSDANDPRVDIEKEGNKATVDIERRGGGFTFWNKIKDDWKININPEVAVELSLEYGAADTKIDISELKVNKLDIDSGATSTSIKFGEFPTQVDIDTGASSFELEFPIGTGVVIEVDGGAVSTNLNGFSKRDGKYYSEGYSVGGNNIEIQIDAGATSIDGSFY